MVYEIISAELGSISSPIYYIQQITRSTFFVAHMGAVPNLLNLFDQIINCSHSPLRIFLKETISSPKVSGTRNASTEPYKTFFWGGVSLTQALHFTYSLHR